MVVRGSMVEAEMVVMTAVVGGMVVKPELRVLLGGGVVTLGRMEVMGVKVGRTPVTLTLAQDLQHMRWYSGRGQ